MVLSVLGFNHRTATVAERESYQLQRRELGEATLLYKRISGVGECLVLATCNRVEFYRVDDTKGHPGQEVVEFYRQRGVDEPEKVLDFAYRHVGAGAARHLFRVIAGMDSLVLGEDQIPGQVKTAYSAACGVGGPGKVLHKLFHHAFRLSKRVRSETTLGEGVRSVPGIAAQLLAEQATTGQTALVIGADETTDVVLSHLASTPVRPVLLNRTWYNAQKLAAAHNVDARPWEELIDAVAESDYIFTATGAPEAIFHATMMGDRTGRPLRIADLAVPRDVDPEVGTLPGVELLDLQDLKYHLERVADRRCDALPQAQQIVEEQVDAFLEWLHAQVFVGGIEAVKHDMHEVANEELQRFKGSFHQGEMKALEAFSHALLKRLIKVAAHHFEPDGVPTDTIMARLDPAALEVVGNGNGNHERAAKKLSCREKRQKRDGQEKKRTGGDGERER
ncbi:glutamyl-tRNA reductase [bacterium]|nr:glutamyl-tRNA reductase [bacterium]